MSLQLPASISEIAAHADVAMHRLEYVIRRDKIAPVRRVGTVNLYDGAAVKKILARINEFAELRNRREASHAAVA